MSKRMVYRAIWVSSVVVLIGMVVVFTQLPTAIPAPAAVWIPFVTSDKSIMVSHPANWQPRESSLHAVQTMVRFEPAKNVEVVINADLQGALLADIAKAGSGMAGSLPGIGQQLAARQKSPLEKLHDLQAKELERELKGFQDGATTKARVAGFTALITDFTFQERGVWGSREMAGRRVTALVGERRLTVVCRCPKQTQAQTLPVFTKMLASLHTGQGGG